MKRFWPLGAARIVTSPFGPRSGGFHYGVDFGRAGFSSGMPVFAIQSGVVLYAGAAQGYGGPDPAGWLVIESDDSEGGGCLEYGHIVRLPNIRVGTRVSAGQQIAVINPSSASNGGTAPHLHLSDMPDNYDPKSKQDPMIRLRSALEPESKEPAVAAVERPDFNEFPLWSPNFSNRNGVKPSMFLLHTQEGNGNALSLAEFLGNPANQVSYHYTVSQDLKDQGVTVVDVVDTDYAAWSVLDYNSKSINLCFAGSSVKWSRDQWMKQAKALDAAAFLAVQDTKKYGFSAKIVPPPYKGVPGISDHAYVTSRGIGSHSDVGPNFPWAFFEQCVNKHLGLPANAPVVVAKPVGPANDQLTMRWNCLGGQTMVEALAEVRDKVLGTNDRGKTGSR